MHRTPVPKKTEGAQSLKLQAVLKERIMDGTFDLDSRNEAAKLSDYASSRHSSNVSRAQSQIMALERNLKTEEEILKVSMEQDQLIAETKLAELKIKEELYLKAEKLKLEHLKKRQVYEKQIEDILQNTSEESFKTGTNRSAAAWIRHNELNREKYHPAQENLPEVSHDENVHAAVGLNEVLFHAFKALNTHSLQDLPTFTGEIMDWPIFESEFQSSTVEFKLNDKENLRRLIKSLRGKARNAVEPLLVSHENVDLIMKLLKTNFGRTEWIIAKRFESLRQLKPVEEGNIESFRDFYNVVIGTTIALKNMKAESYLLNPELVSHVADKLSAFSRQMWIRHKASLMRQGEFVDLNAFSIWLEEELDNQLAMVSPTYYGKKQIGNTKRSPAVVNLINDEGGHKTCILCKKTDHHYLDQCDDFREMNVDERRSVVQRCNFCYVCLKPHHSRKSCKSRITCLVCKLNHNTMVHKEIETDESGSEADEFNSHVDTELNDVLLRIGEVKIRADGQERKIFALFDEGSSLTLLNDELSNEMNLRGTVTRLKYSGINGVLYTDETSRSVPLEICGVNSTKWFKLNKVRTVKSLKLPKVNFDRKLLQRLYPSIDKNILKSLVLAKPQMIIGSNNAGLIVPRENMSHSPNGLQVTNCLLGQTIHGCLKR